MLVKLWGMQLQFVLTRQELSLPTGNFNGFVNYYNHKIFFHVIFLLFDRMTVVQSYICEKLSKTNPKFSDIPAHIGNMLIQAIAINSAYTSRIMVCKSVDIICHDVKNT